MGKAKRGHVYRCKKCKWQNKKANALKNVAKKHVEVPPVHCNPCNFNGVTMACIMEHTKTSTHKKKAATYNGQIIQCADFDLESYLEKNFNGWEQSLLGKEEPKSRVQWNRWDGDHRAGLPHCKPKARASEASTSGRPRGDKTWSCGQPRTWGNQQAGNGSRHSS